jgi:hypothetical protein
MGIINKVQFCKTHTCVAESLSKLSIEDKKICKQSSIILSTKFIGTVSEKSVLKLNEVDNF